MLQLPEATGESGSSSTDASERTNFVVVLDDVIPIILSFLSWKDILAARVCREWKEAAKLTDVPQTHVRNFWGHLTEKELCVKDRDFACALQWISVALPRVPSINFRWGGGNDIAEGENPRKRHALKKENPVDISSIANFRNLQHLKMNGVRLSGSYPFLFDFPKLQTLSLNNIESIDWDLKMLRGVPKLERLECAWNHGLTGNLKSIRHLRPHLIELNLIGCNQVEGDLLDVSDFPQLMFLPLLNTNVTGDVRNIGPSHFQSLRYLGFGDKVIGGSIIPSIQDAPAIMLALSYLERRNVELCSKDMCLRLSSDSPDRYVSPGNQYFDPPFCVEFVKAGNRLGWRWTNCGHKGACETNWLDPAPDPSEDVYEKYIEELKGIENDVSVYHSLTSPPNQAKYRQRNAELPHFAIGFYD